MEDDAALAEAPMAQDRVVQWLAHATTHECKNVRPSDGAWSGINSEYCCKECLTFCRKYYPAKGVWCSGTTNYCIDHCTPEILAIPGVCPAGWC